MSFVSLSDVIDGLHERFATVPGFVQRNDDDEIVNLLSYEPRSIATTPTLYTLLDSYTRDCKGQVTTMRYRIMHRLVVQWQDNEQSERELMSWVHVFAAAVDADPTLAGRITLGLAMIKEAQSGFVSISGTKYRCLDMFADVPTKAPRNSGI